MSSPIETTDVTSAPFQLWSSLPNFFFTSSGAVDGQLWARGNVGGGSYPIWVQTDTPAAGYAPGSPATYNIVMTSQDWLGTEQPMVKVATFSSFVDPFTSGSGAPGNLAAAVIFGSNGKTGTGALVYWGPSTTVSGDYALYGLPITTNYVTAPGADRREHHGYVWRVDQDIDCRRRQPDELELVTNGTSSTAATEAVMEFTTKTSATTENIYVQAFTTAGAPLTSNPILVASNVTIGSEAFSVSYNASQSSFDYNYSVVNGSATGFYSQSLDPTTGALGTASEYLSTPDFTSITSMNQNNVFTDGTKLRFVEGFIGSQQVIQDFLNTGSGGAVTTFDLSSATAARWAIAAVYDSATGQYDNTVLAYTDDNQVHLELLDNTGAQIGDDFVVPGLTSFEQIHTMGSRVEIDYAVTDPKGGEEIEGVFYDTATGGRQYTLGGGSGEYVGTPYDDTVSYAAGVYTVNGGGGDDAFADPGLTAAQVKTSVNANGDVVLDDGHGDVDTLQRFSAIQLADATIAINGKTLTLSATASYIAALTATQIAGLASSLHIGSASASDAGVQLTEAQAAAFETAKLALNAPSGMSNEVVDTAADIAKLTTTQIAGLTALHVTALVATDAGLKLTVAIAKALETANIAVVAPSGMSAIVSDTGANLQTLTAAQISGLTTLGFVGMTSTSGGVALTAAQAVALEGLGWTVAIPSGATRTVSDTAAAIAGLTPTQISGLPAIGVTSVTPTAATNLTVQQAAAFEAAKVALGSSANAIADTAADLATLTTTQIAGLAALHVTQLKATDVGATVNLAQAAALLAANVTLTPPTGNADTLSDTAANIEALTATQIAGLASSLHIGSASASDAGVQLTEAQAAAFETAKLALNAPSGMSNEVVDTAADIAKLTTTQIAGLTALHVTALVATDAGLKLTVAIAKALETANIAVVAPSGMSAIVSDTGANLQTLTAAQISGLTTLGFVGMTSTSGGVALTAAQAVALEGLGWTVAIPSGATRTVSDTAAAIAGLTPTQISGLPAIGVTSVTPTAATNLTVQQAAAFEAAKVALGSSANAIADTAADLATLTTTQIAGLAALHVTQLKATDVGATVNLAQAAALLAANVTLTPPTGNADTLSDTAANIEALTATQIAGLASSLHIGSASASDAGVQLTEAQAAAFETAKLALNAPSGMSNEVVDTAADIAKLTTTQIAGLTALHVTALVATDAGLKLTVAIAKALETANIAVVAPSGMSAIVSDTGANLQTLTAAQISGLTTLGFVGMTSTSGGVALTAAQAVALEGLGWTVAIPSGATRTVSDTAAAIAGLTPTQISGLPAIGVTSVTPTAATNLTVQQAAAFEAAKVALGSSANAIADTAADLATLTTTQIAGLAALHVTQLKATDVGATVNLAQAAALLAANVTLTPPTGNADTLSDTAANIEALTATQIAGLASSLHIGSASASDAGVQLTEAQAAAFETAKLALNAPSGMSNEVVDTAADIAKLTTTQIAGLTALHVTALVATDAGLKLTVAIAKALETANIAVVAPSGMSAIVSDTGANLQTLTAAQISGLTTLGFVGMTSTSGGVALTAAQAVALEGLGWTVAIPSGATRTVSDTAAAIAGLTPTQISGLPAIGVTSVTPTAATNLTVQQAAAFEAAKVALGSSANAIADTAADLATLTTTQIAGLAALHVTQLKATDVGATVESGPGGGAAGGQCDFDAADRQRGYAVRHGGEY